MVTHWLSYPKSRDAIKSKRYTVYSMNYFLQKRYINFNICLLFQAVQLVVGLVHHNVAHTGVGVGSKVLCLRGPQWNPLQRGNGGHRTPGRRSQGARSSSRVHGSHKQQRMRQTVRKWRYNFFVYSYDYQLLKNHKFNPI